MGRRSFGKSRLSRWTAAGAVGAAVAAGIGLVPAAASAATGPSWSVVGPAAVSGTFSAVTSLQYGNSITTKWAFATTADETNFAGYPSVWSQTGTASWARQDLSGAAPGEVFVSATAISPTDVLAFSALPGGTGREWQFNGNTWKVVKSFDAPIGGASVTGPANVWVFGGASALKQLGVYHYNGATWTKVASTLDGGQSLTGSDTYAYTGATIARWNGKTWTGTSLAGLIPGKNPRLVAVYYKFGTVWAVGQSASGVVILGYNGHAWAKVGAVSGVIANANQISSDGGGGVWVPVVKQANQGASEVIHYIGSVKKLTVTPLTGQVGAITRVDGTFELIGGSVPSGKGSPSTYLELEYYN
jgi:hypothetical protein